MHARVLGRHLEIHEIVKALGVVESERQGMQRGGGSVQRVGHEPAEVEHLLGPRAGNKVHVAADFVVVSQQELKRLDCPIELTRSETEKVGNRRPVNEWVADGYLQLIARFRVPGHMNKVRVLYDGHSFLEY